MSRRSRRSHRAKSRGEKVLRKIGEVLPVDFGELSNGTRLVTWLPWVVRLGYHELWAPPLTAARAKKTHRDFTRAVWTLLISDFADVKLKRV